MTQRLALLLCEFANNPVLFVGPRINPLPGRREYDFLAGRRDIAFLARRKGIASLVGRNKVAKPYINCVDRTMLKAVDITELC